MSRLCVEDANLFAKYKQGRLATNVCLISCDQLSFSVESGELRKHSDTLADMAETAISKSGSELVFEEVPSHTLELLVEAMYGKSMKQTCSISDMAALSSFGHKYEMDQMEAIMCEVLATLNPVDLPAIKESLQLYQTVPFEFVALQDAVFQYIMRGYEHIHSNEDGTGTIAELIQPRHVNQWLQQQDKIASEFIKGYVLLAKLQGITKQHESMLLASTTQMPEATQSMLDVHVELPNLQLDTTYSDTLLASPLRSNGSINSKLMNDFAELNSSIKYSAFRSGIQEWCAQVRLADLARQLQKQRLASELKVRQQADLARKFHCELAQAQVDLQKCEATLEAKVSSKRRRT